MGLTTFVDLPENKDPQYEGEPPEGMHTLASGPVHGTVPSYVAFAQSLFGNLNDSRPRLLSDKMWKAARSDGLAPRGISLPSPIAINSAIPFLSNPIKVFSRPKDSSSKLGEGWTILQTAYNREKSATGREAGTISWAGLAGTYFFVDPTSGVGGILAAQILPWAGKGMLELRDEFEKLVYEHQESWKDS